MRRAALAAVVTALFALLSACGAGVVEAGDVEEQISTELEAQVGQAPDAVDCPGDLDAEAGATMTCVLTDGETELDVMIEVTEVDGSDVSYDIEVADPS